MLVASAPCETHARPADVIVSSTARGTYGRPCGNAVWIGPTVADRRRSGSVTASGTAAEMDIPDETLPSRRFGPSTRLRLVGEGAGRSPAASPNACVRLGCGS